MTTLQEEISASIPKRRDILTRRERDCLVLSGRGHSEKEVAQQLDISPNTVRVHIENIKRKLGASNKSHALILSLLTGETELSDFEDEDVHAPL
ncbi:MAG: helix-turn-helix transcriptional regulator [Hyphomicrobium zavarzinii]|uniref:response regulator transcription factor n=1 Tax=Hyphomicrobium TaxID=81 RepID=UPI00037CBD5B|nr:MULTISPECIES: helix-turn-helix transcriptional regulator [Hyphomicrobium]MBL8847965.1 helix-turn-helix transcriptional regulator [Hyphomicrobium zavarzinii]WBT38302.1 helix-turn-helix transcriptional regulator [Hyphomicrobium sp. DMF-1]HML44994.1 helix-turn-helix transcriptional regulator [Hyphomicrobium zavarzinii]